MEIESYTRVFERADAPQAIKKYARMKTRKENAEEQKKKKGGRGESEEIKVAEERPPHSLFHLSRMVYG